MITHVKNSTASPFELSSDVKQEIDAWLKKFPADQKQSAVLAALTAAQQQHGGWLSEEVMDSVADYLEMPKISVYEVATFYDMFDLKPVGKHKINVCTNVACCLRGSSEIVAAVQKRLGVGPGETTPDGKFTFKEVECLAACVGAPMCQIDDKDYHENLTPESMLKLIDELDK